MRIGFTGTRDGMTGAQLTQVKEVLTCLHPSEAHHGDCVGGDVQFHSTAQHVGFDGGYQVVVVVHPPHNSTLRANTTGDRVLPPRPYLERNRNIVDITKLLIAAPKGPETQRSGTWSTVRYARKMDRPVIIVWPDGTRTTE